MEGQSIVDTKKTKKNECNCVCRKNVIHFQKTVGSNYCEPCFWLFICKLFKSRLQVGQLEPYGVSLDLVHVKTIALLITRVQ